MDKDGKPTAAERRRDLQREDLKRDILAAARELVDREGPTALTMRAVADAIGYSAGALYEYFDSKRDILEALYFQGAQGLEGRIQQVVEAAGPNVSPIVRVAMAGRAYRAFALEHADLYLLIFSVRHAVEQQAHHDLIPESDASFASLIGLLGEALERGEIAIGPPEHLAASLWAFVHGFVMLEITGRLPDQPPGTTDKLFEAGLALLGEGLRPRSNRVKREKSA